MDFQSRSIKPIWVNFAASRAMEQGVGKKGCCAGGDGGGLETGFVCALPAEPALSCGGQGRDKTTLFGPHDWLAGLGCWRDPDRWI